MNNARILLINDDEAFIEVMREILEMKSYVVTSVTKPGCLKSLVQTSKPDIILLDYLLKETDGGEICRQLHTDFVMKLVPVVLLSAYPKGLLPLDQIPFTVFIPKPLDLWNLLTCLHELLHNNTKAFENKYSSLERSI